MKLVWLTDIHLNFIDKRFRQQFYQTISNINPQGILITGDIAEAPCLEMILKEMADFIQKPIYFILGNHDYYRGLIDEVRIKMSELTNSSTNLMWLSAVDSQKLAEDIFLIGEDGWADGRLGDYQNSTVVLNDSRMIADLFKEKILGRFHLLKKMQELADKDALQMENKLDQLAKQKPKKIIVLTHLPPFREACIHEGKISSDDWLPYFSSKVMGDVLIKFCKKNPAIQVLVLCGHTHCRGFYQPLSNLIVKTGDADYGNPEIQEVFLIKRDSISNASSEIF